MYSLSVFTALPCNQGSFALRIIMHNNFEVEQGHHPDIPEEYRVQSKAKIYQNLSQTYFLPDKDSRGLSKLYLARVHRNMVFRVNRQVLLQYECGLQQDETLKTSFLNLGLLMSRMNLLLQQLAQPQLGFDQNTLPDENWLLRICRFIDRTNILGAFRRGVRDAIDPLIPASEM